MEAGSGSLSRRNTPVLKEGASESETSWQLTAVLDIPGHESCGQGDPGLWSLEEGAPSFLSSCWLCAFLLWLQRPLLTDLSPSFQCPFLPYPSTSLPSSPAIRWEAAILMSLLHSEQTSGITARVFPLLMICPGSRNITVMISCRISFTVFLIS